MEPDKKCDLYIQFEVRKSDRRGLCEMEFSLNCATYCQCVCADHQPPAARNVYIRGGAGDPGLAVLAVDLRV